MKKLSHCNSWTMICWGMVFADSIIFCAGWLVDCDCYWSFIFWWLTPMFLFVLTVPGIKPGPLACWASILSLSYPLPSHSLTPVLKGWTAVVETLSYINSFLYIYNFLVYITSASQLDFQFSLSGHLEICRFSCLVIAVTGGIVTGI